MKRVLVTGAGGFVGRHTLDMLAQSGYEVFYTSSSPNGFVGTHKNLVTCDLRDPKEVSTLIHNVKPSHLLHLAWYTEHGKFWTSDENLKWFNGSLALYQSFMDAGGQRIVSAGTCAEYDWSYEECFEDSTPLSPNTLYGETKASLYLKQKEIFEISPVSSAWGRIFFAYGPCENQNRFIPYVITTLLRGEEVVCKSGHQKRDFLHVIDIANAFVKLLDSNVEGAVNIASGQAVALHDIVTNVSALLEFKKDAITSLSDEGDTLFGNNARLTEELKWQPSFSLEGGLAASICWWRSKLA